MGSLGDVLVGALNHAGGDWATIVAASLVGGVVAGLVSLVRRGGKSE